MWENDTPEGHRGKTLPEGGPTGRAGGTTACRERARGTVGHPGPGPGPRGARPFSPGKKSGIRGRGDRESEGRVIQGPTEGGSRREGRGGEGKIFGQLETPQPKKRAARHAAFPIPKHPWIPRGGGGDRLSFVARAKGRLGGDLPGSAFVDGRAAGAGKEGIGDRFGQNSGAGPPPTRRYTVSGQNRKLFFFSQRGVGRGETLKKRTNLKKKSTKKSNDEKITKRQRSSPEKRGGRNHGLTKPRFWGPRGGMPQLAPVLCAAPGGTHSTRKKTGEPEGREIGGWRG